MSRYDWHSSNHSQFSGLWGPRGGRSDYIGTGLFISFLFHCFVLLPMVTVWSPGDVSDVQTYSVSIVAGSKLGGPRARLDQSSISEMEHQQKQSTDTREPVKKRPAIEKEVPAVIKSPSPAPTVPPTVVTTATPAPPTPVPTKMPEPTVKPKPTKVPPTKVPPTKVPTGVPTRARPTATIARPTVTPRATATEVPKRTATPTETPLRKNPPKEKGDMRTRGKNLKQ